MAKIEWIINSRLTTNEMLRKTIHISGFLIPLISIQYFTPQTISLALFLTTLAYTTSEIARKYGKNFPIFSTVTKKALRSNFEKNNYAIAPIAFAMGIISSLLFFPSYIAYTSITVLTIGDSFANISGKIFGKTPIFFNKNKSIEGTLTGFIVAFLGSILFVNPLQALIAAAVGMIIESLPLPINDNLAIPLSSGMILILIS